MKLSSIIFPIAALVALTLSSCSNESDTTAAAPSASAAAPSADAPLGQRLIATLPKAREGEFSTAEDAARHLVEALIADDWDAALRATTIRLRCERITFEGVVADVRVVRPLDAADPSAPFAQFLKHVEAVEEYRHVQLVLGGVSEPTVMHAVDPANGSVNKIPERQLIELREQTLYRRPDGLKVATVIVDADLSGNLWDMQRDRRKIKELGVSKSAWVKVTVAGVPSVGELVLDCVVLYTGENWLVDLLVLP